eukprot:3960721-Ditylum_brightwellii.AAC.1
MVINLPGDTHDSTAVSQGFIFEWLKQFYNIYGGRCVVDLVFSAICRDYLNKEAISVRQMTEWGVQGFQ